MKMGMSSPTRKIGKFTSFLTSDRVITAGVAIVTTPIVLNLAARLQTRFGAIPGGITGALIVVAFILFVIAGMFMGIISDILLGMAISAFINAIVSIPRIAGAIGTFTRAERSG